MVWELPTCRALAYRQYPLPGERLWEGRAQEAEVEAQLEISWASENAPPPRPLSDGELESLAQGQTRKLRYPPQGLMNGREHL